jgi:deoxyribodipyrimidine photo-lyase
MQAAVIPGLQVVWFKRDLRTRDHRPLAEAARQGPVLPLYLVEPSVVQAPDFSLGHAAFIEASLRELRRRLAGLGQPLVVRTGEAVDVFQKLRSVVGPFALWAHQETGNGVTFARDRAVRAWAREAGVPFREVRQHGVVRGGMDRDRWSRQWEAFAAEPPVPAPEALRPLRRIRPGPIPPATAWGAQGEGLTQIQIGGERAAHRTLEAFLAERGLGYTRAMSSPVTAFDRCSRLSPHLAWGTISVRQAWHRTQARRRALRGLPPRERTAWGRALRSFESRLRWRDHFMQKLEAEPRIEHESFIPALDALRADALAPEVRDARFAAWAEGRTGYPLVDACMRAVRSTGYLNFRMRAMLVSFASYDLWLDWRFFHDVLARRWLDYEPGIHFPQLQMQSGTTGINALRVYDPTKQGRELDPEGAFVRRWVPELAEVPRAFVHTPWLMPRRVQRAAGCAIGADYPAPVVDHATASRRARAAVAEAHRRPEVQAAAEVVLDRHGSRRRRRRHGTRKATGPPDDAQQALFADAG